MSSQDPRGAEPNATSRTTTPGERRPWSTPFLNRIPVGDTDAAKDHVEIPEKHSAISVNLSNVS